MTENSIEIKLTVEFRRKLRNLGKKYRSIRLDLQPILERLQVGSVEGDQIAGVGYTVFKVRVRNSDIQKGKSGGYRLIYWLQSPTCVVLIDIYSKSEQENVEVTEIRRILLEFQESSINPEA